MKYYLAIDIGASSGRHIIGYYDDSHNLQTIEIYRFKNYLIEKNGHLQWDIYRIINEVIFGIKKCFKKYNQIESLSIDTWGVDYVLLDEDQEILPVYAYRDQRTNNIIDKVHSIVSFERLYEITGCQFQKFNTIYQLYDDMLNNRLDKATDFLMIPEYLIYKLTGVKIKEYTNASTTGMMDLDTNQFSNEIISCLKLNKKLFKNINKPSKVVGELLPSIQKEVNGNLLVKLCPTHDTASAVEGIPMTNNSPYISSGTWSLLGIKVKKGINSKKALKANYSNEYGPNYIRFQKNIMGLWIIQNLSKELNLDFDEMINSAKNSNYKELYDVNDNRFLSPNNMKEEIINWYIEHNLIPPKNDDDIINTTYHSLAYSYKLALDELEELTKEKYDELYIVGGGAKNKYLNELTALYTNKKVIAMPIEATARGNLISQMEDLNNG